MKGVVTAHSLMPSGKFTPLPGGVLEAGWVADVDLPAGADVVAVGALKKWGFTLWACYAEGKAAATHSRRFLVVVDGHPHEGVSWAEWVGTFTYDRGGVSG